MAGLRQGGYIVVGMCLAVLFVALGLVLVGGAYELRSLGGLVLGLMCVIGGALLLGFLCRVKLEGIY